jgi:hypothetical protein
MNRSTWDTYGPWFVVLCLVTLMLVVSWLQPK